MFLFNSGPIILSDDSRGINPSDKIKMHSANLVSEFTFRLVEARREILDFI